MAREWFVKAGEGFSPKFFRIGPLLGSLGSISGAKRSTQSSYTRQAKNTSGARWLQRHVQHYIRGGRRSCLLRSISITEYFHHGSTRAIEGGLCSAKPLGPILCRDSGVRTWSS